MGVTQATALAAPAATAASAAAGSDGKRQTSRIPLELALAADAGNKGEAGAPKTIRLKRPGEQATVKAGPTGAEAAPADRGALGKTSRLDEAVEDDAGTPTRRKTIRVKRPTQGQGSIVSVARSEEEGEEQTMATPAPSPRMQPPTPLEAEPEKVGWLYGLCGIAATIAACLVIYVLVAQAYGPDGSLTPLSYGAPGLELSWTGEVRR
jgi:hypothetical protein